MRLLVKLIESKSSKVVLDEKTYTVGDTQYWARQGKYYSWSSSGGKVEISSDDYYNALAGIVKDPSKKVKKDLPKVTPSDYAKMSNEDLVQYAQQDDPIAQERLILNYQPLVKKLSNKYFLDGGGDKDDLEQEANIGIWDAIKTYDEDKGDLHRHITNTVDRKLKDHIRTFNTQNRQKDTYASSMDATVKGKDGNEDKTLGDTMASKEQSPEEQYIGNEGARQLMDFINNDLGSKEKDAILRFINGKKIPEIAEDMGVSYKTIENALMRARNKIRQYREEYMTESVDYNLDRDLAEIEEDFDLDGSNYSSHFGQYYKDGEEITKDVYRSARKKYDAEYNNYKGSHVNLDTKLTRGTDSVNSAKRLAEIIDSVDDYIEDSNLPTMVKPSVVRYTESHGENIYDTEDRIKDMMEDYYVDEQDAERYVDAISKYTGEDDMSAEDYKDLGDALDELPVYYDPTKRLYRGMSISASKHADLLDALRNYSVGNIIPLVGFTSFSSDKKVACDFANDLNNDQEDNVKIMIINTVNYTGSSVTKYSEYEEREVLYKPDAQFVIKNVDDRGDIILVHVEESKEIKEDNDDPDFINLGLKGPQHTKDDMDEGFDYHGKHYHSYAGRFYCDDEEIYQDEYAKIYNEYLFDNREDIDKKNKEIEDHYSDPWNTTITKNGKPLKSTTYDNIKKSLSKDDKLIGYVVRYGNNYSSSSNVVNYDYDKIQVFRNKGDASRSTRFRKVEPSSLEVVPVEITTKGIKFKK